MTIIYCGKFEYPWSTEQYVLWALRRCGCEVIPVHRSYDAVYSAAKEHHADVILFSKAKVKNARQILQLELLTVCWQWDLYYGFRTVHPVQFNADLLFTSDGGHDEQFRTDGYNHYTLRQGIHELEHEMLPPAYEYDVTFVGGVVGHSSRRRLIKWLRSTYGPRMIHHQDMRGLALNEALSRAKIVVGDSFPSPNYWSNRVYEITGRGGFLLHPKTVGLQEEFTDGVHYVSYIRDDFSTLKKQIDYWVKHDSEREQIRRAGFEQCGEYTYTNRVQTLLEIIDERLYNR